MLQNSPLFQLYLTRLRDFYRQPARIFWVYGFPTVLAIVLGLAFQNRLPAPIQVDLIQGPGSSWIKGALESHNAALERDRAAGRARLDIPAVMVREEPRRGHEAAEDGQDAAGHRAGRLGVVGLSLRPDPARGRRRPADGRRHPPAGQGPQGSACQPGNVYVTEPGSRYVDFLIPGLIAVNTMGGGLWGIGFLLVNIRIGKLLKRFVATPMPRRDFLLALLGARLTFLIPDLTVLLLLGTLAFQMPIRGSLGLVILVDVVGALAFAGIGLLVACRTTTTEAVSGLMNLVMLPQWLFSGVFFSSDRFPDSAQRFIKALPLTQLVGALRASFSRAPGSSTWPPPWPSSPPGRSSPSSWHSASSDGRDGNANRGSRSNRRQSAHQPREPVRPRIGGTSTSSIRWPKNVALARISRSRNARGRLEGDRGQLVEPVQLAGRMDVPQRHGEDQPPAHGRQPRPNSFPGPGRPPADDVIAVVDGLQQRLQVALGPRLLGRRDQDEGKLGTVQTEAQRKVESLARRPDDAGFDHPAHRAQMLGKGGDDGLGTVGRQVGQEDDADAGVGQRFALEVAEEGVVEFLARGHSGSRRR